MSNHSHHRINLLLRTWHSRLGLVSFLFVLWLAISGILINHSDQLGFNKTLLRYDWLKRAYGFDGEPEQRMVFADDVHFYHCFNQHFYIDLEKYSVCADELEYWIEVNNSILLANQNEIFLLSADRDFLEKITLEDASTQIKGLHFFQNNILLSTTSENIFYRLDLEQLVFTQIRNISNLPDQDDIKKTEFPLDMQAQLEFPGINLERVLLDLHSGRLFGKVGVLLVDFFALLFVLISLSGIVIFLKKKL